MLVRKGQPGKRGTIFVLGNQPCLDMGWAAGDRVAVSTAGNRVQIEPCETGLKLFRMRRSPALRVRIADRVHGTVASYRMESGKLVLQLEE